MRSVLVPFVVLHVLVLTACGSGENEPAEPASFEGVPWTLVSGLQASAEGAAPGAAFVNGIVGGSAGCNHYTASYTVDGDKLAIGMIATTQMACPPPLAVVEREYLAALGKVAMWEMDGDQLVLSDEDGNELLRYAMASVEGDYEATAVRTVKAFESVIPGTTITATFAGGTVKGSGGCNTYTATYTVDRGTIHIGPVAATKKVCPEPEGVMAQEAAYFAALEAADHYRTDGPNELALKAADDTNLVTFLKAGGS